MNTSFNHIKESCKTLGDLKKLQNKVNEVNISLSGTERKGMSNLNDILKEIGI